MNYLCNLKSIMRGIIWLCSGILGVRSLNPDHVTGLKAYGLGGGS